MTFSLVHIVVALSLSHICHGVIAAPASASPTPRDSYDQSALRDDTKLAPPSRKLHGRFLHLTDFHPDQFYKVHSSTSADHACHSGKGLAGTYGAETSDCDGPIALINATFDWISANIRDNIDFVIWTGDSARHDSDENIPRSPAQVLGTNRLLADKFVQTFSSPTGLSIPIIPTLGNNDILPHNILLPGPNKWLTYYTDIWCAFVPEEQRHSFEFGGWFYVEVIPNKLAVFSLNTLYFFDRNAGIDDCEKPSEHGFKHMEWLRVQLQFMRDRGMKVILVGHVPPAHTESKMLWEETCWQKYTLWLQQYRDVVVAGLYGHMNIDHFLLSDVKEITIDSASSQSANAVLTRENLDQELSMLSATDYLLELRDMWAKLPKVNPENEMEMEDYQKNKKKSKKDEFGGKWAERFQLSLVSPSIVPNYFPALRVFDYNITGLEDAEVWANYKVGLPTIQVPSANDQDLGRPEAELELRSLSENDMKAEGKKKPQKSKRSRKSRKPRKHKDKHLVIPNPPAKGSPPGPAYSPQPLALLGYRQYFANLTYLNNDLITISQEEDHAVTEGWREGKHGGKKPDSLKPKPRVFAFEIEYSTFNDEIYNMTDLTVRNFCELAYRMGQTTQAKSAQLVPPAGEMVVEDLDDIELKQHKQNEEEGSETASKHRVIEMPEGNLDVGGKKKSKKESINHNNKEWLHFLRYAFVSTVDDQELMEKFS